MEPTLDVGGVRAARKPREQVTGPWGGAAGGKAEGEPSPHPAHQAASSQPSLPWPPLPLDSQGILLTRAWGNSEALPIPGHPHPTPFSPTPCPVLLLLCGREAPWGRGAG